MIAEIQTDYKPNKFIIRDLRNIKKCTHSGYPNITFVATYKYKNSTEIHQAYYHNGEWETIDSAAEKHRRQKIAEAWRQQREEERSKPKQLELF